MMMGQPHNAANPIEKKMADLTTEIVDSHGIDELKMRNGLGLILTWMDMT